VRPALTAGLIWVHNLTGGPDLVWHNVISLRDKNLEIVVGLCKCIFSGRNRLKAGCKWQKGWCKHSNESWTFTYISCLCIAKEQKNTCICCPWTKVPDALKRNQKIRRWHDNKLYEMVWNDMEWFEMIWNDVKWFEMMWNDLKWCEMIWNFWRTKCRKKISSAWKSDCEVEKFREREAAKTLVYIEKKWK